MARSKAVVYIWPLLTKPSQQHQEDLLVSAGYTDKKRIEVNGFSLWRVT